MKTKIISTISMALLLAAFSTITATAQHEGHSTKAVKPQSDKQGKKEMSHDHMMMDMAKEPHHLLAMAYHQNMTTFAHALHEQTAEATSVNVEFTRIAVNEMRRNFDQMKQHHQEHMQTMSADMRTKMSAMMMQMETHHTELNTQLTALEQEIQAATPDAKKVSTLAASISSHLDAMTKMHQDSQGSKMKMKM